MLSCGTSALEIADCACVLAHGGIAIHKTKGDALASDAFEKIFLAS